MIIPFDKEGALETFLLDALSEDKDDKIVVEAAKEFVVDLDSGKYLTRDRDKIKAELGVTFAVIFPDKVFTMMNDLLIEIPWEEYTTVQECFTLLEEI